MYNILYKIFTFSARVAQIESNDTFISSFSNIFEVGFASLLQHFENISFFFAPLITFFLIYLQNLQ